MQASPVYRRRRAAGGVGLAPIAAAALLILRGGGAPPRYSPLKLDNAPWAYGPSREADFASRAAAGHSHAIYVKSPGGIVATAERVARYRDDVEKAAAESGVD